MLRVIGYSAPMTTKVKMAMKMKSTESRLDKRQWIDHLSVDEGLAVMLDNQAEAIPAIRLGLSSIVQAVTAIHARLARGRGRLIYAGAGTSARIAVQDGAELLPTFDFPADRVAFVIAGGVEALLRPVENAEDSAAAAASQIADLALQPDDCLVALAASGRTPFTLAVVAAANAAGALTVGISNNRGAPLETTAEIAIVLDTGAEALAGSTRLKAATAQTICLNLISTQVMTQLGHVRNGLMVSMMPRNEKLRHRKREIEAQLAADDASG